MAQAKSEKHHIGEFVENAAWAFIAIWAGALILDSLDVNLSL